MPRATSALSRLPALARRSASMVEQELAYRARGAPLDSQTVFLEAFGGSGLLCNPDAIFRGLLAADDLSSLRFVWALNAHAWSDPARSEFAGHPRVRFVRRRSPAYYRALGSARYLINNATFPHAFAKRAGQVYVATWHGTPLKAMGYDMPGGAVESVNIVRNFVAADYLLAPNEQTARMYLDAYRMRGLHAGALLRVGTPRIDRQFADDDTRVRTTARLREYGVEIGAGEKVVLFAPTWRGSFATPDDDVDRVCDEVAAMAEGLAPGLRLLVKVHQRVYPRVRADPRLAGRLVPNHMPTNDVLRVADVLVSDYSSILIDFLATNRPIAIYAPDADQYSSTRGLYFPLGDLPGPVCTDIAELTAWLNRLETGTPSQAYLRAREQFCPDEDGHATERVLDVVFRGAEDPRRVERQQPDGRTTLLFYAGGMQRNGITSSALSLLERIDYERYDVTVTYPAAAAGPDELSDLIDPRARNLARLGRTTVTRVRHTPFPFVGGRLPFRSSRLSADARLADEWRRCFGDVGFDKVVDFGGYSSFFGKLLIAGGSPRSTWLHNDIRSEMRSRDRSAWLRANLRRTTSMYRTSDRLVSVSPALCALNATQFGGRGRAARERFTFARNTFNTSRIHELSGAPVPTDADGRPVLPDAPGVCTFITVGRLSQAKNHLRLLSAFASVHQACPATRLLVVGGGPLRAELQDAVTSLALQDSVILCGAQANPYTLMAHADCFVLSSDYEGQPIVLLEALTLGLPIVTTDFGSVSDALPSGTGVIVPRDVASLAAGMLAHLDGAVPKAQFDSDAYNREAMAEFYRAIGPTA